MLEQIWGDTPCPRAKKEPQNDGKRGKSAFRIKPHTQRCSEVSNKPCVHQDPETPQRLRQTCIRVSPVEVVELFKILNDAVKVLHSICQQIWKTQQWPQDWKRSVFIPIPKKGNAKDCSNYRTVALISQAGKVTLKILQARLQQYVDCELPDVQAGFIKGRGTRDQIANICWIMEKTRVPEKHLFLLYWLCQSLWLCGSQETVENSERGGNTRPSDLPLEKPVCRSGSNS